MDVTETDALLKRAVEAWNAPGAALVVVQGDEVLYMGCAGVKELGKPDPVTPDTLFAIASTTKAFTCTTIAMMANEGKMSWDDPVSKYVDYFRLSDPLANANVTLRDLVTHRTGMSRNDMLWYGSANTREEVIRRIGLVKPNTSFRSAYEYNNIMYATAGVAVGNADGSSWEEVVRKRIFEPLGMTGANFSTHDAVKSPDYATPHHKGEDGVTQAVPWRNLDNCAPGGSINAGVRDLSKWLRFQINEGVFEGKTLISPEKLLETRTPQIVTPAVPNGISPVTLGAYGLGWAVYAYRGHTVCSHGGALDGFRSHVVLIPHLKMGFAILVNLSPSALVESVRNSLLDRVLGAEPEDWNAKTIAQQEEAIAKEQKERQERRDKSHKETKPSRELSVYTGAYENKAYGAAHITLVNGALSLQWSWLNLPLEHLHFDTFLAETEAYPRVTEVAQFELDKEGEVAVLHVIGQEFTKVKVK